MIEENKANPLDKSPEGNVAKATAVGVGTGGAGVAAIAWVSSEIERRYGVPTAVTAGLLGTLFGFVARWAAKLLPDV
jgi:hypothetical protein